MLTKGNVSIGLATRFGPNWSGIRCGARTKAGSPCERPAVKKTGRCTRHGGKSTGPRTREGLEAIAKRHTKHGRYCKENRLAARNRAQAARKLNLELKEIEINLIELGALNADWRDNF